MVNNNFKYLLIIILKINYLFYFFYSGILLNWWTTVLNLLIDDNTEVRKLAAIAISKIEPVNQLKCNSSSLKLFFNKFSKCFYDEGSSMFAAYFVWSLNLSDDDYEMDESDVS